MENKQEAIKALRKWKILFVALFSSIILCLSGYYAYSLSFIPPVERVLINNVGAVYKPEDLTKTSYKEGQVKQVVYDTLMKVFSFNYLSYANDEDYQGYLSGKLDQDIPDHRDVLRPLFSVEAYDEFIVLLSQGEWNSSIHGQKRMATLSIPEPPVKLPSANDWVRGEDGRLNAIYTARGYLVTDSRGFSQERYTLDFEIVMERKPNVGRLKMPDYFFRPMVDLNTNEWRVSKLTWTAKRRG